MRHVLLPTTWSSLAMAVLFHVVSAYSPFAQTNAALLTGDGAWCWFGNPRAVFKDGRVFFGYVRAADGRVCLNSFDPKTGQSVLLWASDMSQRDDHDNPGLLELSDGRLLAIYAKHGGESRFYYRLSTNSSAHLPANWSRELIFAGTTAGVTYANPYQLAAENGRVYNFMRNLNFNPTWVESDAAATNWSAPRILIRTGTGGYRPYVQYCSDFQRRIDLIYTDGHPNVEAVPTSLYHLYYQEGALYKSDGTFLKSLANTPLLHDSGERGSVIYQYSGATSIDPNVHIRYGRAWSWEIAYQTNGAPVAAFTVQVTNVMGSTWQDDRIYYYYARWTGSGWQKRLIAHAGRPLYSAERHYAGGITLDPEDPDIVYISSNAESPFSISNVNNVPLRANDRYEIYRGVTGDGGLTFAWQAITTNSVMDNLRPYVPRRNTYPVGVIWFAGRYVSYTDWTTSVHGLFGTNVSPVTIRPNAPPNAWLESPKSPLGFTNLSNGLKLDATAFDDGYPAPLTTSWESVRDQLRPSLKMPARAPLASGFLCRASICCGSQRATPPAALRQM